jgi:hypothetical protein
MGFALRGIPQALPGPLGAAPLRRCQISTRIAAQAGGHILPLLALFATKGFRAARLQEILLFLVNNALSTHPERRTQSYEHAFGLRNLGVA